MHVPYYTGIHAQTHIYIYTLDICPAYRHSSCEIRYSRSLEKS